MVKALSVRAEPFLWSVCGGVGEFLGLWVYSVFFLDFLQFGPIFLNFLTNWQKLYSESIDIFG